MKTYRSGEAVVFESQNEEEARSLGVLCAQFKEGANVEIRGSHRDRVSGPMNCLQYSSRGILFVDTLIVRRRHERP